MEQTLQGYAVHEDPLLQDMLTHVFSNAGKRLRPLLVLLAAHACPEAVPEAVKLAVIVELLHTATLLHDDVLDASALRRGVPTVAHAFGQSHGVLAGDYLYAVAFECIASLHHPRIMQVLSKATRQIVEGEVLQLQLQGRPECPWQDYQRVAVAKTAKLFSVCAEMVMISANAPPEMEGVMVRFAHRVGLLYQWIDDLLDYGFGAVNLGKCLGDDLREGRPTFPWILAYEGADDSMRVQLSQRFVEKDMTLLDEVRQRLASHEGARRVLLDEVLAAEADLKALENLGVDTTGLAPLLAYIADRIPREFRLGARGRYVLR